MSNLFLSPRPANLVDLGRFPTSHIYKRQCHQSDKSLCHVWQRSWASIATLRYYLKLNKVDYTFSTLSNADLDMLVKSFHSARPDLGLRTLIGFLRSHRLRIQKHCVVSSVHRVDGIGSVLRNRTTIRRRKYTVARPNALWHMDGHHKLILWGIVIHGFVDGYSRLVCQLMVSSNSQDLCVCHR
jgi:hypothetical protein